MTSYVKRVGDLTDPENFEKTVAEANKNGELDDFDTDWVDCAMPDTSAESLNVSNLEPCGFDSVTKPAHYAGHTGIECKTAMQSMLGTDFYTAYMQGCAFKYLWRWRDKNGIEDLKKARECIDNVIRAIEGDGDE